VLCGFFVRGGGEEGIINICTVSRRVQSRPLIELANRATREPSQREDSYIEEPSLAERLHRGAVPSRAVT
jgi:hypothetical protein